MKKMKHRKIIPPSPPEEGQPDVLINNSYPEWPKSAKDLIPLPNVDGPKLKPFDFGGQQNIEFVDWLGEGSHSTVYKVKISGQLFALKAFFFSDEGNWLCTELMYSDFDQKSFDTVYPYCDPFSSECRAFGRLHETGHDDVAVRCFGYALLTEKEEEAMLAVFKEKRGFQLNLDEADTLFCARDFVRRRFPCADGRLPPVRAIIKELGQPTTQLRDRELRVYLKNMVKLHQLGIINLDVCLPQMIDNKHADFSTAFTTPHMFMNTEMFPKCREVVEYDLYVNCFQDFWDFDKMIDQWNHSALRRRREGGGGGEGTHTVSTRAFPLYAPPDPARYGFDHRIVRRYNLRKTARRKLGAFTDPRRIHWTKMAQTKKKTKRAKLPLRDRPRKWVCKHGVGRISMLSRWPCYVLRFRFIEGSMIPVVNEEYTYRLPKLKKKA